MRFVKPAFVVAFVAAGILVLQERSVSTQGVGSISAPNNVPGIDKPVRVIKGRFSQDVFLSNDTYWILRGAVFFEEPARLTIQAGTRVIGETATRGTLIIRPGAQIFAVGTREQPIVMTSDQPIGQRGRGDWGGLILNGRANLNLPNNQEGVGEGDTGLYGGDDDADNSGILRYVRVEFAGIEFSPDNELNGIAFQGVGSGTMVDYIHVRFNKDDGVEFYGGNVDAKHYIGTDIGDDSIDWTWGWRGRLQYAVVLQRGDDTDNGIEADNHSSQQDLQPRSEPEIYNVTLIGDPTETYGPESTDGARIRVGTGAHLHNFIIAHFKDDGIDVRDDSTAAGIATGVLNISNGILFNNLGGAWGSSSQSAAAAAAFGGTIAQVNPMLVDPLNHVSPDWRPLPGSPALTSPVAVPPADGFFDAAMYLGALGPVSRENDWTQGWTDYTQR